MSTEPMKDRTAEPKTPREARFYRILAHYATAKMAASRMSMSEHARRLGMTKNSFFRATTKDIDYHGMSGKNLAKIIGWLDLEPADFAEGAGARAGDLEAAILDYVDLTSDERFQLLAMVRSFIANAPSQNAVELADYEASEAA